MATNPQQERPSNAVIRKTLADRDPLVRDLYLDLHALVRETLPDVDYSIDLKDGMMGYGMNQYGADGWGIAGMGAHTNWVTLAFMRGAELPDPDGLLEGTGKKIRHVKVRSTEELAERRDAISDLIRAAAGIG
jgi:hypothetical protein